MSALESNPLRDPQDRRLPRIAGPCGMVLFGVTGDLSRKKVMPAIYDLANRGLLPPGFSLVGFARRDWADQDFAADRARLGQGARPHRVPRGGLEAARRGLPVRAGRLRRRRGVRAACARTIEELDEVRGTGGNHAFYLVDPAGLLRRRRRPAQGARARRRRADGSWRRVVVEKPFGHDLESRPRAQRASLADGLPAGLDLPDRPLPRQGDGPEHPGDALRQRDVRADLELQLRRPRADHDGRGHRHRRPGRLLRRHRRRPRRDPEPPAPADGAGRDGGADRRSTPTTCASRSRRCSPRVTLPAAPRPAPPRAGSTPRAGRAARRCAGFLEEDGITHDLDHRDVRRGHAATSTTAAGRACRSTCAPASGSAAGSPRSRSSSSAAPHLPFAATATEELDPQRPGDPGPARRGHDDALRLQGARHRDGDPRRQHGLRLRRLVHRVQPGGLRAADPRRAARRPAAVPAARGGRAVLADPRPDPRATGPSKGKPGAVRVRHAGARSPPTRCWPATAAPGGGHDASDLDDRADRHQRRRRSPPSSSGPAPAPAARRWAWC